MLVDRGSDHHHDVIALREVFRGRLYLKSKLQCPSQPLLETIVSKRHFSALNPRDRFAVDVVNEDAMVRGKGHRQRKPDVPASAHDANFFLYSTFLLHSPSLDAARMLTVREATGWVNRVTAAPNAVSDSKSPPAISDSGRNLVVDRQRLSPPGSSIGPHRGRGRVVGIRCARAIAGGAGLGHPGGALLLRVPEQKVDVGRALGPHVDLIGEKRLAQSDQREVEGDRRSAEDPIPQYLRKGRRHSSDLLNPKSAVAKEVPHGSEGEQPGVRPVENARLAIVELTQLQHQARHDEGD